MTKHDIKIHNKRIYFAVGPNDEEYEYTDYVDIDYSDEECVLYIGK